MIIAENVVKIFVFDTFVCSINSKDLREYMMEKHKMSSEQWNEYFQVYRGNLGKVGLIE